MPGHLIGLARGVVGSALDRRELAGQVAGGVRVERHRVRVLHVGRGDRLRHHAIWRCCADGTHSCCHQGRCPMTRPGRARTSGSADPTCTTWSRWMRTWSTAPD